MITDGRVVAAVDVTKKRERSIGCIAATNSIAKERSGAGRRLQFFFAPLSALPAFSIFLAMHLPRGPIIS